MISTIEHDLVKAENELRALKTASELAYSTTMYPENTPSRSWNGYIDFGLPRTDGLKCRLRVRFTRSDGATDVPMVDFAWSYSTNPTYQNYLRDNLGTILTGNDTDISLYDSIYGYEADSGPGYVDYIIEVGSMIVQYFGLIGGLNLTINVQAISPIEGSIAITRLI